MDIVIYGAGGLGREINDTIVFINSLHKTFNLLGFIDDSVSMGKVINGVSVIGGSDILSCISNKIGIVLGVADPHLRKKIFLKHRDKFMFPEIIHPTAVISPFASIGPGVLIQSGCVVAANSQLGDCVMMNAHSGVGHDAIIGNYSSIMSFCDVAGSTVLGELVFVGSGAKLIPSLKIANESYICAGSVVFKSVTSASKLLGNPAKTVG
jgi:sugar O-acyltransferase (sialic acid O-acetyltransferase NeuD family)